MKHLVPLLLGTLIVGCAGGNWSNRDLEILYALPQREDLKSKLPHDGSTQSGLGVGRSGLAIGDPSETYRWTKEASDGFNRGIDAVLGLVDLVRTYPPTRREGTRHLWGPIRSKELAQVEARAVMDQLDGREFRFSFEWRPTDAKSDAAWVPVLEVTAVASERFRKSQGTISYAAGRARQIANVLELVRDHPNLEQLLIDYDTASDPVTVDARWVEAVATATFGYAERADGRGRLRFEVQSNLVPGVAVERWAVVTGWLPDGRGRAVSTVLEGDGQGHQQAECWDSQFRLTYARRTWEPGVVVGEETSCAPELGGP